MSHDMPAETPRALRIFVFDDDEAIRALLTRLLSRRGHEVKTFATASPCTSCCCGEHSRCADIIISDISMPGISGLEFLARQRERDCKVTHLALMSGAWTGPAWERAQELSIQPLHKPFDIDMLMFWLDICEEPGQLRPPLAPWYELNSGTSNEQETPGS